MRCDNLGLECSLVVNSDVTSEHRALSRNVRPIQQKSTSPYLNSSHSTSTYPVLPGYNLRRELVLLYFQHVHDKHHSLFHQPSVGLELENEQVPDILLYAMMALGARYVTGILFLNLILRSIRFSTSTSLAHTEPRYRGSEFVEKAKILLNMTEISVTTIQACVLLGTISFSESKSEAEALYYAVANRLAFILDLLHRPVADEIERQVNLRSKYNHRDFFLLT
jgi:hypothetical protein